MINCCELKISKPKKPYSTENLNWGWNCYFPKTLQKNKEKESLGGAGRGVKQGDTEDSLISPGTSGLNKEFLEGGNGTDAGNRKKFSVLKRDLVIIYIGSHEG